MSFYLRKSVSVGPVRFNLSKSGIGVSTGIKGLRLGTSPRGNYIHMGRNGFYYKSTLPSVFTAPRAQHLNVPDHSGTTHMEKIESGNLCEMRDSTSSELLTELNEKHQIARIWPLFAFVFASISVVTLQYFSNPILTWSTAILGTIVTFIVGLRDQYKKTSVLMYNFDDDMESEYQELLGAFENLIKCEKMWHIPASGTVRDSRYHGGAGKVVERKLTTIQKSSPTTLKTNIETISISAGSRVLYFFPDRILVYDSEGVGEVGYHALKISANKVRFVENPDPPSDANKVGETWKFVNNDGSRDKRFSGNMKLPICLYDEILFSSESGLNEMFQVSKPNASDAVLKLLASNSRKANKQ